MSNIKEVIKEASLSIACALDEPEDVTVEDLEHIQNQITTIENYFDRKENAPAFDMETEIIAMNRYYNKGVTND